MEAILEVDKAQILEELDSEVDTAGVVVGVVADDEDIAAAVLAGAIDAAAAAAAVVAAAAVAACVGRGSGGAGETAGAGDNVDVRADGGAGVDVAGETAGEEEAKNSGHRAE